MVEELGLSPRNSVGIVTITPMGNIGGRRTGKRGEEGELLGERWRPKSQSTDF
jgi:hypothetical protein